MLLVLDRENVWFYGNLTEPWRQRWYLDGDAITIITKKMKWNVSATNRSSTNRHSNRNTSIAQRNSIRSVFLRSPHKYKRARLCDGKLIFFPQPAAGEKCIISIAFRTKQNESLFDETDYYFAAFILWEGESKLFYVVRWRGNFHLNFIQLRLSKHIVTRWICL